MTDRSKSHVDRRRFLRLLAGSAGIGAVAIAGCAVQSPASPSIGRRGLSRSASNSTPSTVETFAFARGADSLKLDPSVITDGESLRVTLQLFDTLVAMDDASTNLKPSLAERWDVADDGKSYTFHLRPDIRFHDGTPVDADAVVFNFERWMDAGNPYHTGGDFAYWRASFGGFKNDAQTEDRLVIRSVEAVASHTVRINLTRPQGPFLANLVMPNFAIASPTAIMRSAPGLAVEPVGSGPFRFVEWVPDDRIVLEANPDYWGEPARVQRVVVRTIADNHERYVALREGTVHGIEGPNSDDIRAAVRDRTLKVVLRSALNVGYVAFNQKDDRLARLPVRRAIAAATNRQAIVDSLYGGLGAVASQFVPPALWGYNPDLRPYPYDQERARALLREAGLPDGFSVDLWYMPVSRPYFPDPGAVAQGIASDLRKVGIKVELKTKDWAQYLDDVNRGRFSMWMLGFTGDNGDPDNFLFEFFGALDEENSWDSPSVRDQLVRAQTSIDRAERERLYRDAAVTIYDEVPRLPIANTRPPVLIRRGVTGYTPHPTGHERWDRVVVE